MLICDKILMVPAPALGGYVVYTSYVTSKGVMLPSHKNSFLAPGDTCPGIVSHWSTYTKGDLALMRLVLSC